VQCIETSRRLLSVLTFFFNLFAANLSAEESGNFLSGKWLTDIELVAMSCRECCDSGGTEESR